MNTLKRIALTFEKVLTVHYLWDSEGRFVPTSISVIGLNTADLREHYIYILSRKLGKGQVGTAYFCTEISTSDLKVVELAGIVVSALPMCYSQEYFISKNILEKSCDSINFKFLNTYFLLIVLIRHSFCDFLDFFSKFLCIF